MKIRNAMVLGVIWAGSLSAMAQWQWVDKDGRKVFSDRPPPQDIPEKSILKQPHGRPMAPAPVAAASAADTAPATAAKPAASAAGSGKDKALEEKKAQAEAAEAAKKKAEDDKLAKARAENCSRAKQARSAFDSGRPITQTNAQGERIFLDEAGRTAESKRLDGIIAADCAK